MKKIKNLLPVISILVVLSLIVLIALNNLLAILLLGIIFIIGSLYLFINIDKIWEQAKSNYKKSSKKRKNFWNKPNEIYYQINRFIILPLFLALGTLLVYSYMLLR